MENLPIPSTTKKIRLSYSDPDATDSSSDEEQQSHKIPKRKIHEFIIKFPLKIQKNSPENKLCLTKFKKSKKNRGFVGAHKRSKGKYSSEITDPFTKKRVWLGTFMNAEEASKAYRSKKREFKERLRAKQGIINGEEDDDNVVEYQETEEFGFFNGVQVVDRYGFLLGEFSKLDDLSICAGEDGVFI